MPTDLSLDVRRAIVAQLKSWAPLTALVSGTRIYGEQPDADPQWPFIRYGYAIVAPYEAQGWDGSEQAVTIHAFANGPYTDAVHRIARAIVDALHALDAPANTGIVACEWTGTTVITDGPDPSANKYHAIINFDVTVAG